MSSVVVETKKYFTLTHEELGLLSSLDFEMKNLSIIVSHRYLTCNYLLDVSKRCIGY